MKYIGLDLGNRTVGIATSDTMGIVATGYGTFKFNEKDLQKALQYVTMVIAEKKIEKIVIGFPKNMDGSVGFQAEYVLEFKKMLEDATNLEVILVDERLTTAQVTKVMISADVSRAKRKQQVDKLSAVIILQSYLDVKK